MRSLFFVLVLTLCGFALPSGAATHIPQKNSKLPRGFVTTRGSSFELDGKPYVSLHQTAPTYAVILTYQLCCRHSLVPILMCVA